jgi:hypothetical protein
MLFTSCNTPGSSGTTPVSDEISCKEGICAELVISEPIVIGQPSEVTITISSSVNQPGISAKLVTTPPTATLGENTLWELDAKVGESKVLKSTVTFPAEGWWSLSVRVFSPQGGPIVINQKNILIDSSGVHINPEITPNPNDIPFQVVTPPPPIPKPSPTALPQVEDFTPQEWVNKCGWEVDQPEKMTEWTEISGGLMIPNSATINSQVDGKLLIGFKDVTDESAKRKTRIGLCPLGEGWSTDGAYEWEVELQSGIPIEIPVSLVFNKLNHVPLFIVAFDLQNQRITGIGWLVFVKPAPTGSAEPAEPVAQAEEDNPSSGSGLRDSPQWHSIGSEYFSSTSWPNSNQWTVNDNTVETPIDFDRKWGVDAYFYAAWPAAGGTNGLPHGSLYPNKYSSEMIFGPFNFAAGVEAKIDFYLRLDLETNFDWLRLYVSHNGYSWYQRGSWTGHDENWQFVSVDLTDFAGSSTNYLRWAFESDYNINYTGVWVDDINVQILPGSVTLLGSITHTDRDGTGGLPASYLNVQVWERDVDNSWEFLEEKEADGEGFYRFEPRENWDDDSNDPDRRLDLYWLYETVYHKNQPDEQSVTYANNHDYLYQWPVEGNYTRFNVENGEFGEDKMLPPSPDARSKAIWLFEDLMRTYRTAPLDPGPGRIRWKWAELCVDINLGGVVIPVCNSSFFLPIFGPDGVFIPDADGNVESQDIVVHEIAHNYMSNSNWFWYPLPAGWDSFQQCVLDEHHFFDIKTPECAYTEGWANFVAVAVNQGLDQQDDCIDWDYFHCGYNSQDIEEPGRGDGQNTGDSVEGRISTSLWDLYDSFQEGYDHSSIGLESVWDNQRATGAFDFFSFWSTWVAQSYTSEIYNRHTAVQTLYQNTVEYNHSPLSVPVDTFVLLQGTVMDNAVDLWTAFTDVESETWELSYTIVNTNPECGASIDSNDYLDIDLRSYPQFDGTCYITIRASDGIQYADNLLIEEVLDTVGIVYFPIIISDGDSEGGRFVAYPPPEDPSEPMELDAYPPPLNNKNLSGSGSSSDPMPAYPVPER